jgi:hypothetical protein
MGTWTGAWAGLLGDRAVRKTVALDLSVMPVIVVLASIGAAIDDAMGYYWGVVAGQVVLTSAAWISFLLHTRAGPGDASLSGRDPSPTRRRVEAEAPTAAGSAPGKSP